MPDFNNLNSYLTPDQVRSFQRLADRVANSVADRVEDRVTTDPLLERGRNAPRLFGPGSQFGPGRLQPRAGASQQGAQMAIRTMTVGRGSPERRPTSAWESLKRALPSFSLRGAADACKAFFTGLIGSEPPEAGHNEFLSPEQNAQMRGYSEGARNGYAYGPGAARSAAAAAAGGLLFF